MEPGDWIIVDYKSHPLNGYPGKVVGRRGGRGDDDTWILVYVPSRMRSFLIPQSILRLQEEGEGYSTSWLTSNAGT